MEALNEIRIQVENEFSCNHPKQDLRSYKKTNGTVEYRIQCLTCGALVRAVKKATLTAWQIAKAPAWDDSLSHERWKQSSQRYDELAQEKRNQQNQKWWDWYNQYLRTPEWQARRIAALERDNYVCRGCLRNRATEVHHLKYEHVGNELLFELVGLCHVCHQRADDKQAGGKQ